MNDICDLSTQKVILFLAETEIIMANIRCQGDNSQSGLDIRRFQAGLAKRLSYA